MNRPRCTDFEYIDFLVATPRTCSCTEAARVQPDAPDAPAHDSFTRLLQLLSGINNLYVVPSSVNLDLTKVRLNRFIGNGKSVAIVVAQTSGSGISPGTYAGKGFYTANNFPIYESYANTDDWKQIAQDQFGKMAEHQKLGNNFLLSWTLTLSKFGNVNLFGGNVINLAASANQWLPQMLFDDNQITPNQISNVISTVNIGDNLPFQESLPSQTTAILSMAINQRIFRARSLVKSSTSAGRHG